MTFERLYAPWRMKYLISNKKKDGCIFCNLLDKPIERDPENYMIYRAEETFVMMNVFPYNVGHLMVLPRQHVSTLSGLSRNAQFEMMLMTTHFLELLKEVLKPDGFNVGINLGKAGGAGIDNHLHTHIVPRWNGDSNFMPVLGHTRVMPEELGDTYNKIVAAMKKSPPPSL